MTKILNPERSYTFSKIFELEAPADDITNEFGYILKRKRINLSQ